jgi:hypothetical protein
MAASHAIAMGHALLRRFCGCAFERACKCGGEPSRSGWTVESLSELQQLMREHGSVQTAALLLNRTVRECNIALDRLISRSPVHALAVLEARAAHR